jgi:amidase
MSDELIGCDAIGLSELLKKGEVTPGELLEITIQRIEKVNPRINAVVHKIYDQARAAAATWTLNIKAGDASASGFCGVPFLLKDLIAECSGTPFNEGSRAVGGYISKLDSELVRRHKAGGLIIVGKANAAEFGVLPTTETEFHGATLNPWNPGLTPGGSSGGSAAAVAAGVVPMAHGNDGGGSLRIPASCCGVFALKPTRGRNPLGPLFGDIGGGIVYEHAVTRSVRDSAALLDITSGPDLGDPYWAPEKKRPYLEEVARDPGRLKIGFLSSVPGGWNDETDLDPDCKNAVNEAARLCESLGHTVEEVSADKLSYPEVPRKFIVIFSCFVGHIVAYWERELGKKIKQEELEPVTWDIYRKSSQTTGADYLVAVEELQRFARKIAVWYHTGGYDLLLSPTMRIAPTRLGAFKASAEDPMRSIRVALSFVAFTRTQNITGQPAMSVPLYWNKNGIPIGVQFAGRFGEEGQLFRLAAQLEQARPWADRIPPIHCSSV